jgi:hypothetical protein
VLIAEDEREPRDDLLSILGGDAGGDGGDAGAIRTAGATPMRATSSLLACDDDVKERIADEKRPNNVLLVIG